MNNYVPYGALIQMRPNNCPKYSSCNANICPLDPGWFNRTYMNGEAICFYILEAQKPKAKSRFHGAIEGKIYQAICIVVEPMKYTYSPLKTRLERAKITPSRLSGGLHVRNTH